MWVITNTSTGAQVEIKTQDDWAAIKSAVENSGYTDYMWSDDNSPIQQLDKLN